MKLLIATGNPSKLKMFQNLLKNFKGIEFFSLSDFPEVKEPIEDGKTTEENALIKAKYYCKKFNINVLADDAGLKIHDLDGKPGVMARRWGGELPATVSDDDFLEFLLKKIIHINKDKLPACFPFSRCLYLTTGNYFFQTERIDVFLSKIPRRPYKKGWPVSALKIFPDGRHNLDIPDDDPVLLEGFKKEGLFSLLNNLVN